MTSIGVSKYGIKTMQGNSLFFMNTSWTPLFWTNRENEIAEVRNNSELPKGNSKGNGFEFLISKVEVQIKKS